MNINDIDISWIHWRPDTLHEVGLVIFAVIAYLTIGVFFCRAHVPVMRRNFNQNKLNFTETEIKIIHVVAVTIGITLWWLVGICWGVIRLYQFVLDDRSRRERRLAESAVDTESALTFLDAVAKRTGKPQEEIIEELRLAQLARTLKENAR